MSRLLIISALISGAAFAADPQVTVQADVIYASTKEGTVDPSLEKMRDALATKVKYRTMKKLDGKKLELKLARTEHLTLANNKTAEITLQDVKDNVATLKLRVPPTEAVYSLAREKSLSMPAGAHDGGDLWLVVSQPK